MNSPECGRHLRPEFSDPKHIVNKVLSFLRNRWSEDPRFNDLLLRFPYELVQEYEHRSDLKFVFDEQGLGRPNRGWQNLSLWDWALTNGGHDVSSFSHLQFSSVYNVVESR